MQFEKWNLLIENIDQATSIYAHGTRHTMHPCTLIRTNLITHCWIVLLNKWSTKIDLSIQTRQSQHTNTRIYMQKISIIWSALRYTVQLLLTGCWKLLENFLSRKWKYITNNMLHSISNPKGRKHVFCLTFSVTVIYLTCIYITLCIHKYIFIKYKKERVLKSLFFISMPLLQIHFYFFFFSDSHNEGN